MKKNNRILKNEHFQTIIRHGKLVKNDTVYLYYREKTTPDFKVGIAVSKKIGNAVTRNFIKRRINACLIPLTFKLNKEYIFVAKPRSKTIEFTNLATIIENLIMKTETSNNETK